MVTSTPLPSTPTPSDGPGSPSSRADAGPPAGRRRPRRDEALLWAMLGEVNHARSEFRAGRGQSERSGHPSGQQERARRLAVAMEAYADAASSAGVPLPYRYREEIRLYRSVSLNPR